MRLLVISCGASKKQFRAKAPAVDVYDGPTYRIIRSAILARAVPADLKILILSAKLGIIEPHTLIEHYDQKMTAARAAELRPDVERDLRARIAAENPVRIHLVLSHLYREAFPAVIAENAWRIDAEDRGLGYKLQTVKTLVTKESAA